MPIFQLDSLSFSSLFKVFAFFSISNAVRYFLVAGTGYLIFWKWGKERFVGRRIENRLKQEPQIQSEMFRSLFTMLMFGLVGVLIVLSRHFGISRIYSEVSEFGWGYFVFSIILMLFLHDTYFYFLHRLIHHPMLYKKIHLVHHLSVNPTPFTAFSFHPMEAILEAGIVFLATFLIPVHIGALFTFTVISLLMNVHGHLGYDLYPKNSNTHPFFKWMNTSTAHNHHHQWINGNYGLYFSFWDRWLKTWKE